MRLWEGRKLIRRKAEDKAGAASQPAWFFDREEPVSNHGEEQSREVSHVGDAAKGEEERGERRFLGCTTITAVSYTHVPT